MTHLIHNILPKLKPSSGTWLKLEMYLKYDRRQGKSIHFKRNDILDHPLILWKKEESTTPDKGLYYFDFQINKQNMIEITREDKTRSGTANYYVQKLDTLPRDAEKGGIFLNIYHTLSKRVIIVKDSQGKELFQYNTTFNQLVYRLKEAIKKLALRRKIEIPADVQLVCHQLTMKDDNRIISYLGNEWKDKEVSITLLDKSKKKLIKVLLRNGVNENTYTIYTPIRSSIGDIKRDMLREASIKVSIIYRADLIGNPLKDDYRPTEKELRLGFIIFPEESVSIPEEEHFEEEKEEVEGLDSTMIKQSYHTCCPPKKSVEIQDRAMCGRHSINNLFIGEPKITNRQMDEVAEEISRLQSNIMLEGLEGEALRSHPNKQERIKFIKDTKKSMIHTQLESIGHSRYGGSYDISVLKGVLERYKPQYAYETISTLILGNQTRDEIVKEMNRFINSLDNYDPYLYGFILQQGGAYGKGGHYECVRARPNHRWCWIDSIGSRTYCLNSKELKQKLKETEETKSIGGYIIVRFKQYNGGGIPYYQQRYKSYKNRYLIVKHNNSDS